MKIKTSTLEGVALDWAVSLITNPQWSDEDRAFNTYNYVDTGDQEDGPYAPSQDWAQGGPLSEWEGIETLRCNDLYFPKGNEKGEYYEQYWKAEIRGNTDLDIPPYVEYGPTPLIAAMRCLVASKLGNEVEIPKELKWKRNT